MVCVGCCLSLGLCRCVNGWFVFLHCVLLVVVCGVMRVPVRCVMLLIVVVCCASLIVVRCALFVFFC